jgi:large subunit ribosomal protein L24
MAKWKKYQSVLKPRIKKGDTVVVISGNQKGEQGEVLSVDPQKGRVLVQGINERTRHQKPTQQNPRGGKVKKEMPVALSNLMVVAPDGTRGRVRIKRVDNGEGGTKRVRYIKNGDTEIDLA